MRIILTLIAFTFVLPAQAEIFRAKFAARICNSIVPIAIGAAEAEPLFLKPESNSTSIPPKY